MAVTRTTITTPAILKAFDAMNARKTYPNRIKPFNFILAAHVAPIGHPEGADPSTFHLIAPFERDARKWPRLRWVNRHDGARHHIQTDRCDPHAATVKTHASVLKGYSHHPESKSYAPSCSEPRRAAGLLARRPVYELERLYIGKEANDLASRQAHLTHDQDGVLTTYHGPPTDAFTLNVVPILKRLKAVDIAKATGVSIRWVKALRNGATPCRELRERLTQHAADAIRGSDSIHPDGSLDGTGVCAAWSYWPEADGSRGRSKENSTDGSTPLTRPVLRRGP